MLISETYIAEKVVELTADAMHLKHYEVNRNMHIRNDLQMDDLDFVTFIMDIEDTFNMNVPDDAADKFVWLEDVIKFVTDHKNKI